jgi:hypothetical protein
MHIASKPLLFRRPKRHQKSARATRLTAFSICRSDGMGLVHSRLDSARGTSEEQHLLPKSSPKFSDLARQVE